MGLRLTHGATPTRAVMGIDGLKEPVLSQSNGQAKRLAEPTTQAGEILHWKIIREGDAVALLSFLIERIAEVHFVGGGHSVFTPKLERDSSLAREWPRQLSCFSTFTPLEQYPFRP